MQSNKPHRHPITCHCHSPALMEGGGGGIKGNYCIICQVCGVEVLLAFELEREVF